MSLIEALFTQTATVIPFVRDGAAEPIYGESTSRKCRIERGKYLTNVGGASGTIDQVTANALMFCVGEQIPERSKVIFDDREFTVINCAVMHGFADNHIEVYLQ